MDNQSTAWAIDIDSQGNSYVTGSSNEGKELIATVKYDSMGVQQWVARYSLGISQGGDAVAVSSAGDIYVAGHTAIVGDPCAHYITIKYNSQGIEQWHRVYASNSYPAAITADPSGNVFVTGASLNGYYAHGYLTIEYDSAGNQIWAAKHEGLGNGQDDARAIVYDAVTDTVIVTGGSFDSATTAVYATIKYNIASGIPIWTANYVGALHFGGANAIAADSLGNIYVTGGSVEGGTLYDYATVKYSRNGVQRWSAIYDSGILSDYGLAIAVGNSGKVYVTGSSATGTGDQYATIGYLQQ